MGKHRQFLKPFWVFFILSVFSIVSMSYCIPNAVIASNSFRMDHFMIR
jgi:hypothetical protein